MVLDDAVEEKAGGEKVRIGMVVSAENGSLDTFEGSCLSGRSVLKLRRSFVGIRW